jgi:hypothetical protein
VNESVFDDPDLGQVMLRSLTHQQVLVLWSLVAGLDLRALAREVDAVGLGMPVEHAAEFAPLEGLRMMLEMHVVVNAALIEPEPPKWPAPPGDHSWLILPGEEWNGWALERLDKRALELAGMPQHPEDDEPRRSRRVARRPDRRRG